MKKLALILLLFCTAAFGQDVQIGTIRINHWTTNTEAGTTNDILNLANQAIAGSSNSFVASTLGNMTNGTISSNLNFQAFPTFQYDTNEIGIWNCSFPGMNGTYVTNGVSGVWTNWTGNSQAVVFQNPTYFLQNAGTNVFSTTNPVPNSTWLLVAGSWTVPSQSGYGTIARMRGMKVLDLNAQGLIGLTPMVSLDTTKVLTNNETAPTYVDTNNLNTNFFGGAYTILGNNVQEGTGGTTVGGTDAHVEGVNSTSTGIGSHAEGNSIASGNESHAEGSITIASGANSHAEGAANTASATDTFAGGQNATANLANSYAWSDGTSLTTPASRSYNVYALNGINLRGGVISGNGGGLTNLQAGAENVAYATNSGTAATATVATNIAGGFVVTNFMVIPTMNFVSIISNAPSGSVITLSNGLYNFAYLFVPKGVKLTGISAPLVTLQGTNTPSLGLAGPSDLQLSDNDVIEQLSWISWSNATWGRFHSAEGMNQTGLGYTNVLFNKCIFVGQSDVLDCGQNFYTPWEDVTFRDCYINSYEDIIAKQSAVGFLHFYNCRFNSYNGSAAMSFGGAFDDNQSVLYGWTLFGSTGSGLTGGSYNWNGTRFHCPLASPPFVTNLNMFGYVVDDNSNICYNLGPLRSSYSLTGYSATNYVNSYNTNNFIVVTTYAGDGGTYVWNPFFSCWTNTLANGKMMGWPVAFGDQYGEVGTGPLSNLAVNSDIETANPLLNADNMVQNLSGVSWVPNNVPGTNTLTGFFATNSISTNTVPIYSTTIGSTNIGGTFTGNGSGLTNLNAANISHTIVNTNFGNGQLYTNNYGTAIAVSGSVLLTTASVAGYSQMALRVPGSMTNYATVISAVAGLTGSMTNAMATTYVPPLGTYIWTNTSSGAGDASAPVGGQIFY
jgi:hypothetical protein